MSIRFTRTREDFICQNCGESVGGDGYTNHCPNCLYSQHVDVDPGDRAAECGGMMEPVTCEIKKGMYVLTHRCLHCGHEKRNKAGESDNRDALIKIAQSRSV